MKSVDSGRIIRHTYLMRTKTAKKGTLMARVTATNVGVGDQVEVNADTSYINHACGVTSAARLGSPSEFATVAKVESYRSRRTFTFTDGRIMFTSNNSKVTTS